MSTLKYEPSARLEPTIQSLLTELAIPNEASTRTIFWAGNGGCAALAEHMAAELVTGMGTYPTARRSISLTSNSALLSALANDRGYDQTFSVQLEVLAEPGDTIILLTTSGRSANMLEAAKFARRARLVTVAFTAARDSPLFEYADVVVQIETSSTQVAQEEMTRLLHEFCSQLLKG
ncbi:SIS domain-containing protein [Nocardiopsis sp. FR4]|uniref:SIS domain-containing protein n=1 Tax=Nocardiopsis sp. FR4 TaxID=2605985 RepID=UPI00135A82F4